MMSLPGSINLNSHFVAQSIFLWAVVESKGFRGDFPGTNIGDYTGQEVKRVDWPVNIPAPSKESSPCPNVSTHSLLNPKKLRAQNGSEPIKRRELLAAGKAAPRPCFSLNLAMLKHLSFCPQNIHFILN